MAEIGKFNELVVVKHIDFGFYLDAGELGEVLLPKKYAPKNLAIGDTINVFLYFDSEDRPIATTQIPYAQVGEFAYLKVIANAPFGAFLDWGLLKDLLVPINEQNERLIVGKSYVVYVYIDKQTGRITGTAKVERYLDLVEHTFERNDEVELLIYRETDLGLKAIINNTDTGVLYYNELLGDLSIGQKFKGYIKKVRSDGKIDLSVQFQGYEKIDSVSQKFLDIIKEHNGVIKVSDKSDPHLIFEIFGESKKTYKKAIGTLYKKRIISIDDDQITLLENTEGENNE